MNTPSQTTTSSSNYAKYRGHETSLHVKPPLPAIILQQVSAEFSSSSDASSRERTTAKQVAPGLASQQDIRPELSFRGSLTRQETATQWDMVMLTNAFNRDGSDFGKPERRLPRQENTLGDMPVMVFRVAQTEESKGEFEPTRGYSSFRNVFEQPQRYEEEYDFLEF